MLVKTFIAGGHAVGRMLLRFPEWENLSNDEIRTRMETMAFEGAPVGGQIDNNIAIEVRLQDGTPIYLVGHTTATTMKIRTVLTREQLAANMGMQGLGQINATTIKKQNDRRRRRLRAMRCQAEKDRAFRDDDTRPTRRPQPKDEDWRRDLR